MTEVVYGYCPRCSRPEFIAGTLCYQDSGLRVVACTCGSRQPPVPDLPPEKTFSHPPGLPPIGGDDP